MKVLFIPDEELHPKLLYQAIAHLFGESMIILDPSIDNFYFPITPKQLDTCQNIKKATKGQKALIEWIFCILFVWFFLFLITKTKAAIDK